MCQDALYQMLFEINFIKNRSISKYLRALGYDAPKNTPQSKKKYEELSEAFVAICKRAKVSLSEADLEIWKYYSGKDFSSSKIPQFKKLNNRGE